MRETINIVIYIVNFHPHRHHHCHHYHLRTCTGLAVVKERTRRDALKSVTSAKVLGDQALDSDDKHDDKHDDHEPISKSQQIKTCDRNSQ